ncbi:glycosyltransferase family 57 protein [Sistotremastrum suecicum HHB10207 ss-3]|uniref:Alpha-1,3-glucosyltransferase n=1 Tax=Sistotremastrum suecicum HHB10207 ss-3 TaxID=1314776 RepID=A0A166HSP9_9AGAM|nr:glycosyltransferase family 57 protein [Sistotremastrum suecicum HHB10207 ss-3]
MQATERERSVSYVPSPLLSVKEHVDDSESPESSSKGWKRWWAEWGITSFERDVLIFSTAIKVLLFPSYRSTDFEVHRNWLAITHSLPLSQWYLDTTSEWTLDYPPFFAYFEWLLSIPASFVDPKIVDLHNLNYGAWTVVAYQRSTVILTELLLALVLFRFIKGSVEPSTQRLISVSLFLHPGFLIVDHIHFQYNGFMFGILLWSLLMARNGDKLTCGLLFAVLLNFKHIYMYLAPAYFIYLLRSFCMSPQGKPLLPEFISLANTVILTFTVSLAPFALYGQLPQLFSRLFPFTRGLNHAYWAPNFWALVTALDRVLLRVVRLTGMDLSVKAEGVSSTSRGLVGDTLFAVLPDIKPIHTFAITVLIQAIFLVKLWRTPTYKSFITAVTLCGYTSFLFGWHVHEKAVLLILVPLSLIATENHAYFRTFVIASVSGIFGLFPLLFTPQETIIKLVYSGIWMVMTFEPLGRRIYEFPSSFPMVLLDRAEKIYLAGFPLLQLVVSCLPIISSIRSAPQPAADSIGHSGSSSMDFLPLMITSVYCAIGLCWAFVRLCTLYMYCHPR